MAGYTKLFSSIVTSTIWCEDAPTRIVWVAMLALKDRDGRVDGSIPGFARVANVTVEEMERAVGVLMGPDPHSRTPDNEGRRIEAVPGGWRVLNHEAYRALESEDHRRAMDAARSKRYRERHGDRHDSSRPSRVTSPQADADAVPLTPASPKSGEAPPAPLLGGGDGAETPGLDAGGLTVVTQCNHRPRQDAQAGPGEAKEGGAATEIPPTAGKAISGRSTRFVKPTPQEVEAYAAQIGYSRPGLGAAFCDFYAARGWLIGKAPMRDWKAAVRTWKNRDAQGGPNGNAQKRITGTAGYQPGKYAGL